MAVLILIGIIPLVVFTLIFINTYRAKAISQRINELQTRGSIICNLVVSSAYFTSDSGAEVDSELTQVADIFGGRILIADSDLNITRDTYGLEEGKVILLEEVVRCVNGADSKFVSQSENMVELVLPVHNPESNSIDGVVVMNFSLNSVNTLYDSMQSIAITLVLVLGLIILVISVLYSGQVVMPMKEVAGSIAMISSGDFNETMQITGYSEAEDISDKFNSMLSVLQNLEDARQEFVSNVSHELKTPITSVKVLAESLIGQENVPVELYQEFMVDINEELERMRDSCNNSRDLAIIDILSSTGIRVGELVNLNISDIDLEKRECIVLGKGNKQRKVYSDARTKIHLHDYITGRHDECEALFVSLNKPHKRLSIRGIEIILHKIGSNLKSTKVHPHKFRRTLATKAIDKGMPIEQVQVLLGHSQIDTTLRYAMVNQNNVKASHHKYIG